MSEAAGPVSDVDVVVVGAGPAGATAATLLGRQGLRVAMLERSPDPAHYKVLCTHEIGTGALPVLERLGVLAELKRIGGPHRSPDIWTSYGWTRAREASSGEPIEQGLNVRRAHLDPMLRRVATDTEGVEVRLGSTVKEVLRDGSGRVAGVRGAGPGGEPLTIRARLVVAADGRSSKVAELAGLPVKERRHERLGYAAYFSGVPDDHGGTARMWLRDPDVAYAFPTDGGQMLVAAMPVRTDELVAAFRADPEGELRRVIRELPDAPDLTAAAVVDKPIGAIKVTNQRRRAAAPGIACVGDAAMVSDYLWGTGIGYAVRSSAWLAELAGPALATGSAKLIDRALRRYRLRHARMLGGHYLMAIDYSTGRTFTPPERLLYSAATEDQTVARQIHELGGRARPAEQMLTPALLRAARVRAGRARRQRSRAAAASPSR